MFSWFNWIALLCFPVAYWASLKQMFWILYTDLHAFGISYWMITVILLRCFLEFSCSLKVYIAASHWSSRSPLPVFTNLFEGGTPSISLARDSEPFQTFSGYTCSMLITPSCGRIQKFVCLLLILKYTRLRADSLPFIVPRVALNFTFVVLPNIFWPAFCPCSIAVKAHPHLH